jgi:NitT/TauT family transport system ATP-binding protein
LALTGQGSSASAGTHRTEIAVRQLTKTFSLGDAGLDALRSINLKVPAGEFCCIVGPSGCGKTTLLRILAGLEKPSAGDIEITATDSGRPLNSMVFQEQSVFPWMTVEDNIGFGLQMRRVDGKVRRAVVADYIGKVGLQGFARAYPHQLSGGMKQRVAVARAFANDPEVLLMDEPFASLDEQTKIVLQDELLKIWEGSRKTVIFITHSIEEAVVLGDRVVVMTARPGRIKADVLVDLPRPRSVYELKSSPAFAETVGRIWSLLRDEVITQPAGS